MQPGVKLAAGALSFILLVSYATFRNLAANYKTAGSIESSHHNNPRDIDSGAKGHPILH